jgi:alpha-galactosidase
MRAALANLAMLCICAAGCRNRSAAAWNELAKTPPMGWNSWNKFQCNVSEQLIKETADAMVSSGMLAAGYQFVNVDDCWQLANRAPDGTLVADPRRFPSGMKSLANYVHSKGLKFGLYTDAGTATCAGRVGMLGHELQDARTYVQWGVDYLKVDWCNTDSLDPKIQYKKIRDALTATGRPIVLSICNWGVQKPWEWAPGMGHLWRTTYDITDSFGTMLRNADFNATLAAAAGPGGWNDPDMLEVGNGGMVDGEYRSHFSLWAVMAAPLIAGNDIRSMSDGTKAILMNTDVIAIDQDVGGIQGKKISSNGGNEVWSKKLASAESRAVLLFNRNTTAGTIRANFADIGLDATKRYRAYDLWRHRDLGTVSGSYQAVVEPHDVVFIKIALDVDRR